MASGLRISSLLSVGMCTCMCVWGHRKGFWGRPHGWDPKGEHQTERCVQGRRPHLLRWGLPFLPSCLAQEAALPTRCPGYAGGQEWLPRR